VTDALHIIDELRAAATGRAIAGLLLRVPDAIVLSHGVQLQAECMRKRFAAGATFLDHRAAALAAVRDAHGLIPMSLGLEVESWRETFSVFAAGRRGELPDYMRGADGEAPPG
jgi:hypothetical protein